MSWLGDLAGASAQLVLRDRRPTAAVAELHVEKLTGCWMPTSTLQ